MKITVHRAARLLAATAGLAAGCALAQSGAASSIDHRIALPSGWFTPQAGKADVAATAGTGVYLVQLEGTTTDARLEGLRRLGATPLQYVEHDAWLVLADAKAGTALAQPARFAQAVRAANYSASNRRAASLSISINLYK